MPCREYQGQNWFQVSAMPLSHSCAWPDAAGMSDTEQVLACLHADALLLRARLDLKLGLQEAAAKVAARQERLRATLQKRDQQAGIFGARTRKERRLDAAAVDSAGVCPQTAPVSADPTSL